MPLLWISLAFLIGICLAAALPWAGYAWAALTAAAAWIVLRRVRRFRPLTYAHPFTRVAALGLLLACLLGAARYQGALPAKDPGSLAALNGHGTYQLTGVVASPPDERDHVTYLRLQVTQAALLDAQQRAGEPTAVRGMLLLSLPGRADWRYGDRLQITGQPIDPPPAQDAGDFSYADYLARQGIYSVLSYAQAERIAQHVGNPVFMRIYALRDRAYHALNRLFPAPAAGFLSGILLGMDNDLPPGVVKDFQRTGTSHIIAISGFNIAIVAALVTSLFSKILPKRPAALLSLAAIIFYTLLVGASASVVRAAIMGSLGIVAHQFGRRAQGAAGLNILAFCAAVMCLINPTLLWDVGFQLSFAATLGLMLYAAPLQQAFSRWAISSLPPAFSTRVTQWVSAYLLTTLAAQITTLPVIWATFGRFPLSSLLINPLTLPVQAALMILSGLAVMAGMIFEPLGRVLAWFALPLASYTLHVIHWGAALPGQLSLPQMPALGVALIALAGVLPAAAEWLSATHPNFRKNIFALSSLSVMAMLLTAFVWQAVLTGRDYTMHVTAYNIEGKAAWLVQSANGNSLLIQNTSSANRLGAALGTRLQPIDHHLDAVLIIDCRTGALAQWDTLIERYPARSAWWACANPQSTAAARIKSTLAEQGAPTFTLQVGDRLALDDATRIEILAQSADRAALWISYGGMSILIPGGMGADALPPALPPPTALLLTQEDIQPNADLWEQLGTQSVILIAPPDPTRSLPPEWTQPLPGTWHALRSDGEKLWASSGR